MMIYYNGKKTQWNWSCAMTEQSKVGQPNIVCCFINIHRNKFNLIYKNTESLIFILIKVYYILLCEFVDDIRHLLQEILFATVYW